MVEPQPGFTQDSSGIERNLVQGGRIVGEWRLPGGNPVATEDGGNDGGGFLGGQRAGSVLRHRLLNVLEHLAQGPAPPRIPESVVTEKGGHLGDDGAQLAVADGALRLVQRIPGIRLGIGVNAVLRRDRNCERNRQGECGPRQTTGEGRAAKENGNAHPNGPGRY